MIVKHLNQIKGTDRDVDTPTWNSRRLLLKSEGMGFSMHDTIIKAGTSTEMCYLNHLEAVYCIQGTGVLEDLTNGEVHPIEPGVLYALDGHEHHILTGHTDLRMICVFNPPVTGREVHDSNGAYALAET